MNNIIDIIKFISDWQNEYDNDFKPIPIDEQSTLIFNCKNQIYKFIFSDVYKRNKCRAAIPRKLMTDFTYMIEQEDGFTYYLFTKGDFE